ncbi:hypothetical protein QJS10_CPA05g00905 [Acorus calamus]|uniref:Uncharacterized protein n=1 Tax=Acorus calamus TaxID=4465 RepID=A0AAV9EUA7_ACOCL|nr:hypothetical protein QJS10_CPA05g00905 [Acorus calamus]
MGICGSLSCLGPTLLMIRAVAPSGSNVSRLKVLEQLDVELKKGNDRAALSLVRDLQGKPGGLRCFGAARQHEAGHFLIAYLLGVLPKDYTLTSLEALRKTGSLNVQAGTSFVDFEFLEEVNMGKLSSKMLDKFSCIALAGVATEYLLYGYAEGGLADINQVVLDIEAFGLGTYNVLFNSNNSLFFACGIYSWTTYLKDWDLLKRRQIHRGVISKLVKAMAGGRSVGLCAANGGCDCDVGRSITGLLHPTIDVNCTRLSDAMDP